MANILDITDFTGYKALNQNQISQISNYIAQSEKKYLSDLLGVVLYTEFIAGLNEVTIDTKWTDLRDGATIVHDSNTIIFEGVKAMLLGFTYNDISKYIATTLTAMGGVLSAAENGNKVSNTDKEVRGYNEALSIYGYDWNFDFYKYQTRKDLFNFEIHYKNNSLDMAKIEGTAYNFIKYSNEAVADTYSNWIFKYKFPQNYLGI